MAVKQVLDGVMQRLKAVYNGFFYDGGEAPAPQIQQEYPVPYADGQQLPPQVYQPGSAAADPGLGAPPPYAQGYPAQNGPEQAQQPAPHRVRRAERNQQDNVVDFSAYQQQAQQPAQEAGQQPAVPTNMPPFPGQQAQESPVSPNTCCARIINARGMADCRSAITLLRKGDSVLIVLENVTDPTEMRRLVDTLSGACYSLTATITKVSRYGVYLLAPQPIAVFADQATNLMNTGAGRAPRSAQAGAPMQPRMNAAPQGGYPPQMPYPPQGGYAPQGYYAAQGYPQQTAPGPYQTPQRPFQQPVYAQQPQSFTQRTAMPEEAPQDFYQRPAPQAAAPQGIPAPQDGRGFAMDPGRAVDQ